MQLRGGVASIAVVAVLAFVATCASVTTALPAPLAPTRVRADLVIRNSSCLTPKQDEELKKAIAGIQITLSATVTALDIAAAAESNPKTKKELKEAATVIHSVSKNLVSNLTEIVEDACGTCSQIVRVVNESAQAIENTIAGIAPELKNTTTWTVIVTAINDILEIAEIVCPEKQFVPQQRLRDSCLNGTQLHTFEKVIAGIQTVLTAAEVALDVAASSESDPKTKQQLQDAEKVVKAISVELIGNLTKIAESPCATCTEIVNIVEQLTHALEDTLKDINPNWANDPLWKSIVTALDQIFGYIDVICPSSSEARFVLPMSSLRNP